MKKMVFVTLLLVLGACQQSEAGKPITDTQTKEEVIFVSNDSFTAVEYLSDGMDRGNHEFYGKLSIDEGYYANNPIERGNIIYFTTPKVNKDKYPSLSPSKENVARVIALENETIEIINGEVYINDRKLDAFYSQTLSYGLGKDEYFQAMKKQDNNYNKNLLEDYFLRDMKKVKVPPSHVFVLGDNGWRSIDSTIFGALPQDEIIGKVIGMIK
jgi:signal peptidase I